MPMFPLFRSNTMLAYYSLKKAERTVSVLKASNSVSIWCRWKINGQIIKDASFVKIHTSSVQIIPGKIKHLLPEQSVSPSKQGFAAVNDWYHLETEDWQARRQFKITIGHLRFTVGIYQCLSVQWKAHTTSVLECKGFSFPSSLIYFEITQKYFTYKWNRVNKILRFNEQK